MRTFQYFPPGPEEQRAFVVQLFGTVLAWIIIALLWKFWARDAAMIGVLVGAALGAFWMLARSAWTLEKKAQRSQNAEIGVDDAGLHITDDRGRTQSIAWSEISDLKVVGGRLTVTWPGGQFAVGARELEDGMTLMNQVMKYRGGDPERDSLPPPPSNFIPLSPR